MMHFISETDTKDFMRNNPVKEVKMSLDGSPSLNDIFESFALFLRGCGYAVNGEIEIVNENDMGEDNEQ